MSVWQMVWHSKRKQVLFLQGFNISVYAFNMHMLVLIAVGVLKAFKLF